VTEVVFWLSDFLRPSVRPAAPGDASPLLLCLFFFFFLFFFSSASLVVGERARDDDRRELQEGMLWKLEQLQSIDRC
jgi:hypothetical protein